MVSMKVTCSAVFSVCYQRQDVLLQDSLRLRDQRFTSLKGAMGAFLTRDAVRDHPRSVCSRINNQAEVEVGSMVQQCSTVCHQHKPAEPSTCPRSDLSQTLWTSSLQSCIKMPTACRDWYTSIIKYRTLVDHVIK